MNECFELLIALGIISKPKPLVPIEIAKAQNIMRRYGCHELFKRDGFWYMTKNYDKCFDQKIFKQLLLKRAKGKWISVGDPIYLAIHIELLAAINDESNYL